MKDVLQGPHHAALFHTMKEKGDDSKSSELKYESCQTACTCRECISYGLHGENIRVVTLDTGVYLHPDLRQNVVGFLDFVAMKRACYDDNGHGTHVGGILCANGRMKGMAPQAQLIALKVLGKDGGGQTERVIRGLQWVLAHHKELGIRILNFL